MITPFIAIQSFNHQVECFCPDGNHSEVITIHEGDIIEITPEQKYNEINGWYFQIIINHRCSFFISLEDLEWYFLNDRIVSMLDVDLQINYYQYKINEALDGEDKGSFMDFTEKMNASCDLKMRLNKYLRNVAV